MRQELHENETNKLAQLNVNLNFASISAVFIASWYETSVKKKQNVNSVIHMIIQLGKKNRPARVQCGYH